MHRASYLHFIPSILVVENVWLLWRNKTSKRVKEDAMKAACQNIWNCGVCLLTWYGETTQYPVFPASKAEGKGKESLVVRNSESELKVWNEGNEPLIIATNSKIVLACLVWIWSFAKERFLGQFNLTFASSNDVSWRNRKSRLGYVVSWNRISYSYKDTSDASLVCQVFFWNFILSYGKITNPVTFTHP